MTCQTETPCSATLTSSSSPDKRVRYGLGMLLDVADFEVAFHDLADADEPMADAWVSTTPGLALAVLAADCVPVLLADPDAGVIGAAVFVWLVMRSAAGKEAHG